MKCWTRSAVAASGMVKRFAKGYPVYLVSRYRIKDGGDMIDSRQCSLFQRQPWTGMDGGQQAD